MTVSTGTTRTPDAVDASKRRLVIDGGTPLHGSISVAGSKNAALPLLAATLLTSDEMTLNNVPNLSDIGVMVALLKSLGAEVEYDLSHRRVTVRAREITNVAPDPDLVAAMRASFLVTGPLLARMGEFISLPPGGCNLGQRPIDVDTRGFARMGATITLDEAGVLRATVGTGGLTTAEIFMDYPSHTGTENLLMASVLSDRATTIVNASCEPEVVSLGSMLNRMGARIRGLGSPVITIDGVDRLFGVRETVPPDRLEAGTYAMAALITGGEIRLVGTRESDMLPVRAKLEEAGATIWNRGDSMLVQSPPQLKAVEEIQTLPFPGFPTDLQAAFGSLMTQADGVSRIKERVFNDRLRYAFELNKMGADITVMEVAPGKLGDTAIIRGKTPLTGCDVSALDIRGGAGVVLAGLAARGTTSVADIHHLERGYEHIVGKLQSVGASIREESVA